MRFVSFVTATTGALLLAATPRAGVAQTFEGEVGLRTPNGQVDALLKGNRARLNTQTQMGPAAIIIVPDSHQVYIVIDAQRMYVVMKTQDALRMADSSAASSGAGTLTSLGRKDKVAEIECEVFRFQSATSAEDLCVASGIGQLGVMSVFGGAGMGGMGRGRPAGPQSPGWAGELARRGGFPLRIADTTGNIRYEVTRIEKKKVDEALLTPPADYQRMEMPSFGRPPEDR